MIKVDDYDSKSYKLIFMYLNIFCHIQKNV